MSGADMSAGPAVRISAHQIEAGPKTASTDSSAPSGFPGLLSRMATANNLSANRPAISIAGHRSTWGKEMSRVMGTLDEKSDGGDPVIAALLGGESESTADAMDQSSAGQPPAAPSPLDTTLMAIPERVGSTPPLPDAIHMPMPAMAGICVSQPAAEAPGAVVFPQVPAADAVTLKEAPRDMQARAAGVLQGAPEKQNVFALPRTPAADAVTPKDAPRDLRAAASGGVAASQLVTVLAQETHIAPAVLPPLAQGVRDRAGRVTAADPGAAPAEGTEQVDIGLPSPRVGIVMAAKPPGPPPEQPLSMAQPPSEQDSSRNVDVELGSSASPPDHAVSGVISEPPHAPSAAPLLAHQLAGQIVAAAAAIQREEAQPTGAVAVTPLASPVVKILRLELQPADLGTITIRLSLKEDGLDIRVEASRYDTACLLQRDQDALAKLLTTAGYRIDGMTVVAAATDGASVPDGRSQAFLPSSTPQHWGSSQPDSRSSGGRPNADPDPRTSPNKQNDDNDKSRIARGAGGDLYV